MKPQLQDYLDMLGMKGKDRVSAQKGVITSVSFDLYGCVQVVLDALDDKGERRATWYDHKRIEITDEKPVMPQPVFTRPGEEGGGCEKPVPA